MAARVKLAKFCQFYITGDLHCMNVLSVSTSRCSSTVTRRWRTTSCPVLPDQFGASSRATAPPPTSLSSDKLSQPAMTSRSMHELRGPPSLPVVGNFLTYLKKGNRGKMHEVQARQHKTYGTMFREKWGSNWQVHISNPRLIEEVYRREGCYPNRPSIQAWILYRNTCGKSLGLVTAQNKDWQTHRADFGKRMLSAENNEKFVEPFNLVADDLVTRLRYLRDGEGERSLVSQLPNEMYKWSLEAAGAFLFETRLGCFERDIPQQTQEFIDATQEMMTSTLFLIVGEQLHKRLNTPFWRKHKLSWDKIFEIGKELIDRRVTELNDITMNQQHESRGGGEGGEGGGGGRIKERGGVYLTYLLENKNVTMADIYSNVTELLLAGTDTTANSLCFALNLLASHKEAQVRLKEEVWQILRGQKNISSDNLNEMKYLQCVLKETMRLYPVVTMNCRILDDDIVLDGYLVPKKTLFVLNHYAAGRDEDIFPKADKFIPERWLRTEVDGGTKHHPFACLPFGYGQRSCVGRRVAKMEIMITIAKILQNFDLDVFPGVTLNPMLRTLLTPGEDVPVRFIDTNQSRQRVDTNQSRQEVIDTNQSYQL